jgi:iron(III) transport system substrate-binding protein
MVKIGHRQFADLFHLSGSLLYLLLSLLVSVYFPSSASGDVQSLIDQTNSLPEDKRQAILLQETKKEPLVNWYTDMQPGNAQEVLKAVAERYPFLKIETVRLGHERLINRVISETRAGKFIADVVTAPAASLNVLREAGVIARNAAPFRKALRSGIADNQGWINPVSTTFYAVFYNTKLVKPGELPNRYEDLLSPRWKGMIAIDQEDAEWLAGLIETMGREKALDFAKKLSANEVNVRRGHTLLGQLVAAGESAIFPDQYLHSGLELKKKGAPVDMYFIEPVLTQTSKAMWITQNSSRPYAALLFTDFLFSKEIQMMHAAFGRSASRRDVSLSYGLETKKIHYLANDWTGGKYQELSALFREIFAR